MPRLLALVIAASVFGTSTAAFAAPALEHVRGTVKSISDTELVVHTMGGTDETVHLTGTTGYLTVAKSNLDHIDPGGYIGVATKSIGDKGDKPVALGVLLFPPAMKGALEGHFNWDPIPDTTLSGGASTASAMTNGTVAVAVPATGARKAASTMTRREADRLRAADGACRNGRTRRQVRCDGGQGRLHQCRPAGRSARRRRGFCGSQLSVGVNGATPPI